MNLYAEARFMRLLTRAFFLAGRVFYLASSCFHSAAAASLTLTELRGNIRSRWQTFNDKPADIEAGLTVWEADVADRLVKSGDAIFIVGCGSGREVVAYLERGCRVTGLDPAPRALGIARDFLAKRGLEADLIEGFIDETSVAGTFDAVLFGWWSYCQIPEASRRVRTLQRLAAQLKPGGRIALNFDVMTRPRPLVTRTARMAGALARSDWRVEDGDIIEWRRVEDEMVFGFNHAFVVEEIEREASAAGLRISYRRDPPDHPAYILERAGS